MSLSVYMKQGDTYPTLKVGVQTRDGVAAAIPGGSSATFRMVREGTGEVVIEDAPAALDLGTGVMTYEWGADDLSEPGRFFGEFTVTMAEGVARVPATGFITVVVAPHL